MMPLLCDGNSISLTRRFDPAVGRERGYSASQSGTARRCVIALRVLGSQLAAEFVKSLPPKTVRPDGPDAIEEESRTENRE